MLAGKGTSTNTVLREIVWYENNRIAVIINKIECKSERDPTQLSKSTFELLLIGN